MILSGSESGLPAASGSLSQPRCREGVNQSRGTLVESGALVESGILVDSDGVNQSCDVNQSGSPISP